MINHWGVTEPLLNDLVNGEKDILSIYSKNAKIRLKHNLRALLRTIKDLFF